MSGMEVWTPVVHEFAIDGRVTVGPLKAAQFARVQTLMRPVAARLTKDRLEELAAEGHDDLCRLIVAATGVEREWLDTQDTDDLLRLLGAVIEINADFSRRRIAPAWAVWWRPS